MVGAGHITLQFTVTDVPRTGSKFEHTLRCTAYGVGCPYERTHAGLVDQVQNRSKRVGGGITARLVHVHVRVRVRVAAYALIS